MPAWAGTLPGAADESVTRTWRTMPICRWPTTEHHPSSDWLTTPTSRRAVVPGARRGVWMPESRTRSCVVVVSRLVTSTTSRSPRGTVIVEGANLMSSAITWTVVVCPVGVTSLEARAPPSAGEAEARSNGEGHHGERYRDLVRGPERLLRQGNSRRRCSGSGRGGPAGPHGLAHREADEWQERRDRHAGGDGGHDAGGRGQRQQ